MRKVVNLTENDLRNIVRKSVNRILREVKDGEEEKKEFESPYQRVLKNGPKIVGKMDPKGLPSKFKKKSNIGNSAKGIEKLKKFRDELPENYIRRIVKNSMNKVLNETSSFDMMKYDKVEEYRQTDPSELSDYELRAAVDYMLAYRWALEGDEQVLSEYIEELKYRGIDD